MFRNQISSGIQVPAAIPVALLIIACWLTATSAFASPCGGVTENEEYDHHGVPRRLPEPVQFNAHIRPIMSNTCFACHGPDDGANESGIRLDSREAAIGPGGVIVPGDVGDSALIERINDRDDPMPPADFRHQLSDYEKALFRSWIEQGARYQQHWAWSPLQRPAVPEVANHRERIANPIDAFVLSRLELEGKSPAPLADRATLLRRLSLDLTGLPPTWEEVQAFENDQSQEAWENQVERLLQSPRYGERMAANWLDIVRFSDTVGFHGDQNQRIFPWRDYVIRSINENQPFDQFTREQLAGDLFDQPTRQQLVATGLIRLNMMTREGGAQPEEYLARYSADRVRMIGTAWLGATTGCCECHHHKFDPFTIRDFYSLGAFFDDVRQWGVYSDYPYTPNPELKGFNNDYPFPPELRLPSESLLAQIRFLQRRMDQAAAAQLEGDPDTSGEFQQWLVELMKSHNNHASLWQSLRPHEVTVADGEKFRTLADSSLLFTGDPADGQTIEVELKPERPMLVRSVQIEVLPDGTHNGRVGRSDGGRFSTRISISHRPETGQPDEPVSVRPRYVRVELDGKQALSLAEVEVFASDDQGPSVNIGTGGNASQSSTDYEGDPGRAIDGNTDGEYHTASSTTHTRQENNPWWELDLGRETVINRIVVWNRTDGGFSKRLKGYRLVLLDENRQPVYLRSPEFPDPSTEIEIPESVLRSELLNVALPIAHIQADRRTSASFSGGQPQPFVDGVWNSGPSRWQLPDNETRLPHTAVCHLEQPVWLTGDDRLVIRLQSQNVGRVRFSVAPDSRLVAGGAAATPELQSALRQLGEITRCEQLAVAEREALFAAWYRYRTPLSQLAAEVQDLRTAVARGNSGLAMTMVSQPVATEQIRQSRVLPRGNWQDQSGEPVVPNTPAFLPGSQRQPDRRLTRMDLANWLTSTENPLTPRHFVNRTWKHFFGTALSAIPDDLGNQGDWPSHPQLLDWLAVEFRQDWDRKHIVRLIVNSSTYRQRAAIDNGLKDFDPANRLLAQQSARRLEAEIVRDNALFISGLLLTDWIGGPSVFPAQPDGYYSNLQFPGRTYPTQTDGRQYRRGVYMHWQRTFLHPMLANFDAPARDECVADRTRSNSPQQALTLLNDPVFVEASRAFASRLLERSPEAGFRQRLTNAFRIALSRDPDPQEMESLEDFFRRQSEHYRDRPQQVASLLQVGEFRPAGDPDPVELAAWSQVCRVILNLHETITRF